MPSPSSDLVDRLATDPTAPWLTDVELTTGARSELSVTSAVNGVAKAAHLVASSPSRGSRLRLEVRLPLHWQAVLLVLGCWRAGGLVGLGGADDRGPADVLVVGPEGTSGPAEGPAAVLGPDTVWVTRLHPLGLGFDDPPPFPLEDLAPLLRSQPDQPPPDRGGGDLVAARVAGGDITFNALQDRAAELARLAGPRARVLTTAPLTELDGLAAATTLPSGEHRSVVLVRDPAADRTALQELVTVERITATVGIDLGGVPRLA